MKVIPVTGLSGSGKTTFIRTLVPLLTRYGPVGTVKHTGHHSMLLPKGKDTTVMFEAGALVVAGIDQEKTLITLKGTSLTDALDFLAGQGIAIAVMEGYKGSALPKIIVGDLEAGDCILRNPDPEDVIPVLDRFPDYFSLGGILRGLEKECGGRAGPFTLASSVVPLQKGPTGDALASLERALPDITRVAEELRGVIRAKAAIRRGALFGGPEELLIVIAAESTEDAAAGLEKALSRFREMA
jgi:molybdopterin synthase catalytic subunit